MVRGSCCRCLSVMTRARCHIYLTADYGLNALLFAGFVKCYRAVHDSVVSKGAGSMTRTFCGSGYLRNTAGAVKQAVFAVQMQMYEILSHKAILSDGAAKLSRTV